jgi:hypothetical protein
MESFPIRVCMWAEFPFGVRSVSPGDQTPDPPGGQPYDANRIDRQIQVIWSNVENIPVEKKRKFPST